MSSLASRATGPSESAMRWLVLATAYILLVLFLVGIFDVLIGLYELFVSGRFRQPLAVVDLLDTVLLLLILVEVHRTLIAYVRNDPVVRIVIGAAIIAIAREIISFRLADFPTADEALTAAISFTILLIVLVVAYYLVYERVE